MLTMGRYFQCVRTL